MISIVTTVFIDSSLPLDLPSVDLVADRSRVSVSKSYEKTKEVENSTIGAVRLKHFHFNNYYGMAGMST